MNLEVDEINAHMYVSKSRCSPPRPSCLDTIANNRMPMHISSDALNQEKIQV